MIRYILVFLTTLIIFGLLIFEGQAIVQDLPLDPKPLSWPSSGPKYMQTTVPAMADLTIEKSDSSDPALVGSVLTYTIIITNEGPSNATGLTFYDPLPSGVDFSSVSASQGSCRRTGFIITCDLNNLNNLATATVTIVVTPTQGGTIINTVAVAAESPDDPDTQNNFATEQTVVQHSLYLPILIK